MDSKDLRMYALRKTIAILENEGLKYNRAEFGGEPTRRDKLGFLIYQPRVIDKNKDRVEYRCYYEDIDRPDRGKKLKKTIIKFFVIYTMCCRKRVCVICLFL